MIAVSRRHQRGVAAVEFALVFTVLFLVVYGIATFGAVLYTQQAVSRSAEDGARAIALMNTAPITNDPDIQGVVYDSLASSLVVPSAFSANLATRRGWIVSQKEITVTVTPAGANPNAIVVVTVTYPYSANPLLPSLSSFLDTSQWVLRSSSIAAIQPT